MPNPDGSKSKAEVTSIREIPSPFTARIGQLDKEIQYTIDGKGPFYLYIPVAEYVPKVLQDRLQARVNEWAAAVGMTVEHK